MYSYNNSNSEERDTHVTPTSVYENSNIYWEERRVIEKKLRAWLKGEYREQRDAWFSMRTTPTLRDLYRRAPDHVKLAARRAWESVIIAWFLGSDRVELRDPSSVISQTPMIFNLNLNINNNENKIDVRFELPRELQRKLDNLLELLEFIAYQSAYPVSIKRRAEDGYQTLRRLKKMLYDMN